MEDIRLDEEPLLKSGNTERYSGFESLVFRHWSIGELVSCHTVYVKCSDRNRDGPPNSSLAQLVERLFYIQDVVGSNPTGTTIYRPLDKRFKSSPFHGEDHGFESHTGDNKMAFKHLGMMSALVKRGRAFDSFMGL